MPELPILDEQGALDRFSPVITRAVMLFPDDQQRGQDYVVAKFTATMRDRLERDEALRAGLERFGLLSHPVLWDQRMKCWPDLRDEANERCHQAHLAAEVLATFLAGATSRNHAVKLVSDAYHGVIPRSARSNVEQYWTRFRSVSHLWLAAIGTERGFWLPNDRDDLCLFLNVAGKRAAGRRRS